MKKLIFLFSVLLIGSSAFASVDVSFRQDTGTERSIEITLSGTPSAVTVVNVPDDAIGFKIYARSNTVRFAVNRTVAAVATSSSTPIAVSSLAIGGFVKGDTMETRVLPPIYQVGASRTLNLSSASASTVCDVEFW